MKLSSKKVNSAAIEGGAWIGGRGPNQIPIPDWGDVRLRVRGINNTDFRALQANLISSTAPEDRETDGRLKVDVSDRITTECLVETVLTNWSGLQNDDETPIPYSKDLAREILSDRDNLPFREAVMWASAQVANLRGEQAEAAAKN